jgi:uncharacterized protein YihD (DUF1040 family)
MSQEGFVNYNGANFDPNQMAQMTSTVIQSVVVLDKSPSISSYVDPMNTAMSDVFMNELRGSHRKDDIVLQCVEFCEKVTFKSGFQRLVDVADDYLITSPQGSGTALYSAVYEAMKSVKSYREDLEAQGIEVRTNIFIITDGEDNSSSTSDLINLKQMIKDLRSNESWINTFTISMFGVGSSSSFEASCREMGLDPSKCLSTVGTSAKEIREMMGVVSKSASSSVASQSVTF